MAQNYLSQMLDAYQFYQEHDHFFVVFCSRMFELKMTPIGNM